MTVSLNDRRTRLVASGGQTDFDFDFPVYATTDIVVTQKVALTGVITELTVTTHYTTALDGAAPNTGTVTLVTAAAVNDIIAIEARTPGTRPTNFVTGGDFFATSVNAAEDKQTFIAQELRRDFDRTVILNPVTSDSVDPTLPDVSASKVIGWNAAGTGLENVTPNAAAYISTPGLSTDNGIVRWDGTTGVAFASSGVTIDDNDIVTFNKRVILTKGADLTSAATLVVGTDGNYFDVAGNTGPITAMTVAAGTLFVLQFDSTPTLTHHATNLALPGGANITAAAGDRAICFAEAANTVRVLAYEPAAGYATARIADLAVTTAKIAALNVTAAKIDDQVVNDLTTVTAVSGDYVAIADVSDSNKKKKALISDITALVSSGLVPISTGTAANSASLEVAIPTGYDEFIIQLIDIVAQNDNVTLALTTSSDNGSSYAAGTSYSYAGTTVDSAGTTGVTSNSGTSSIPLTGAQGQGNAAGEALNGYIHLFNPRGSAVFKHNYSVVAFTEDGGETVLCGLQSCTELTTDVDKVKLAYGSGNIVSGTARLYGVKNS